MANKSYPDDDGSRTVGGQHSTEFGRESCYDVRRFMCPVRVGEMQKGGDPSNSRSDSDGDQLVGNGNYPVDGDANTTPGRADAAYPAPNLFTSVVD